MINCAVLVGGALSNSLQCEGYLIGDSEGGWTAGRHMVRRLLNLIREQDFISFAHAEHYICIVTPCLVKCLSGEWPDPQRPGLRWGFHSNLFQTVPAYVPVALPTGGRTV